VPVLHHLAFALYRQHYCTLW